MSSREETRRYSVYQKSTNNMTAKKKIERQKARLPLPILYNIIKMYFSLALGGDKPEYHYDFDESEVKGKQVILLSDHSATDTYKFAIGGYSKYMRLNPVVGKHHFYTKGSGQLLMMIGAIPKSLYESDIKSTMLMLSVLKKGGSLALFPEGVQSSSGSNHPIHPTTAKFIKKAGVTVVLCKSFGSYLRFPRYDKNVKNGRHEYHYEILFRANDLKSMTEEEIYDRLLERFKYNDFEWNLSRQNKYTGKHGNAYGIDNILFICPKCGAEFSLQSGHDIIECRRCGNRIKVTDTYDIIAADDNSIQPYRHIDEWYKTQRIKIRNEVKSPDFKLSYKCRLELIHTDKRTSPRNYVAGEGLVTIDHEGLHYEGSANNENVHWDYDIHKIPGYINVPEHGNEFFYNGEYYRFYPIDDTRYSTKYMMIVEELHNLIDPRWDKVSRDAYK